MMNLVSLTEFIGDYQLELRALGDNMGMSQNSIGAKGCGGWASGM